MKNQVLQAELDFVGARKKISWFNASLAGEPWFQGLLFRLSGGKKSLRNILYSLFPATEYACRNVLPGADPFYSLNVWKFVLSKASDEIVRIVSAYGTQGNIPQRVAIFLDYISRKGLFEPDMRIIELGCSGGLLGLALENWEEIFYDKNGALADRFFWLKRKPCLPPLGTKFDYLGIDLKIPPVELLPYFVWDKDKRVKISDFQKSFSLRGEIREMDFRDFLKGGEILSDDRKTIIITSFFLYHFENSDEVCDLLDDFVFNSGTDMDWLDLSRNRNMSMLAEHHCRPDYIYLTHNCYPIANIINGSDDCPDWEYI